MADPREAYGIEVEQDVVGPYSLVPSRHATPETGGLLDYGIGAFTTGGRPLIIGELFAAAIGTGQTTDKIRINTKRIGERLCYMLNSYKEESCQDVTIG